MWNKGQGHPQGGQSVECSGMIQVLVESGRWKAPKVECIMEADWNVWTSMALGFSKAANWQLRLRQSHLSMDSRWAARGRLCDFHCSLFLCFKLGKWTANTAYVIQKYRQLLARFLRLPLLPSLRPHRFTELGFYLLSTSKIIPGRALPYGSVHLWWLYSDFPAGRPGGRAPWPDIPLSHTEYDVASQYIPFWRIPEYPNTWVFGSSRIYSLITWYINAKPLL